MLVPLAFWRDKFEKQFPCGEPPKGATMMDFVAPLAKLLEAPEWQPKPPGNLEEAVGICTPPTWPISLWRPSSTP